ncbi:flagellar transcriptional regulator FlhD [Limnohabitans sp. DM1]|uniref:flagellar transcriptional regulator FlhD n=1 Tax=Limnohabitans sp. DM1 TaxID=1597955 RepID=UPI000B05E5C1|nr:flagellar transcriptional regulator FlhD [Limnohabitans sp. DM1]
MNNEQLMTEIREVNLTYLMLAQRMIRDDPAQALYRLGISEEVAQLISTITSGQLLKIASGSLLLCHMRGIDEALWSLLSNQTDSSAANHVTNRLHANIVMSSQFAPSL